MDTNDRSFFQSRPVRDARMPLQTKPPKPSTVPLFPPRRDYASVSIKDLLDAREVHRRQLSNLPNVVGTAIGRYLIHEDDWYASHPPDDPRPKNVPLIHRPRTLDNSIVRPWSWPAVLVFVKQWQSPQALGDDAVPRTLFLTDGRAVPTCVILATPDENNPPPALGPFNTSEMIGGGYACFRTHQGDEAVGTFACLARKGGSYYALTNQHVSGGDGEVVSAFVRGGKVPVGITSSVGVERKPFGDFFPSWATADTESTLDAGLIKVDDISYWTSQAFGVGEIGEVFDATQYSVTLDLIGCPVRAFGGFTGVAEGEIKALFFAYDTSGGVAYVSDVLIGPRPLKPRTPSHGSVHHPFTHPGDSGTLWFYDPPSGKKTTESWPHTAESVERGSKARRLRPVAMQWGGQRVDLGANHQSAYALGSFLSSICRSLDIEIIRDWSTGHDEYWGKIGHFSIGWKACDQLDGNLSKLMKANQQRIGYNDKTISAGSQFKVGRQGFVPLADVPDYVWVTQHGLHPNEPIQHFADIDIYDIDGNPSLLDQCVDDPSKVAASEWRKYFDGFASKEVGPEDGALPFRVWQLWDAMVGYLQQGDIKRFVAAGGVMAHYVGDASQPLHCSYLHHGKPPMVKVSKREYPMPRDSEAFKEFKTTAAAKIHAIYEETMLEVDTAAVLQGVDDELKSGSTPKYSIESGHDAGVSIIRLMKAAQTRLSPEEIIDADDSTLSPKKRADALWNNVKIRNATITSLADSVRLLAALWTSAWKVGKGDGDIDDSELKRFTENELMNVYRGEKDFAPSMSLQEMVDSGKFEPPGQSQRRKSPPRRVKKARNKNR